MSGNSGTEQKSGTDEAAVAVLIALSASHLLNDMLQSLIPAIYPILKETHRLTFTQVGLITFAFQSTASLLQPAVGAITDRRPQPNALAAGMGATLVGLLLLSVASDYPTVLAAAALVGVGSAVFHPEASRVARLASGGRHGFAQSLFQAGGNIGAALGPLVAAFIVAPRGPHSLMWLSVIAVLAIFVLFRAGQWHRACLAVSAAKKPVASRPALSRCQVVTTVAILLSLLF